MANLTIDLTKRTNTMSITVGDIFVGRMIVKIEIV